MPIIKKLKDYLKPLKKLFYNHNISFHSHEFTVGKGSKLKVDPTSRIVFHGRFNIEYNVILRAVEHGKISIGDDVFIGDYSTIRASDHTSVKIGNHTMIAQGVKLISTNHAYMDKNKLIKDQHIIKGKKGITVGNDCWIGAGSVILPGVSIGNGAVIGANSVVTKDVPEYAVMAGNPSKVIRYRMDIEQII